MQIAQRPMEDVAVEPAPTPEAAIDEIKDEGVEYAEVDTLIFDIDDTLYPVSSGFSDHRNSLVPKYMVEHLGFDSLEAAWELRNEYFKIYHSSNKGLIMAEQDGKLPEGKHFNKDDLDAYWADHLEFERYLPPSAELHKIFEELRATKLKMVLFSNSPRKYVLKCCDALQIRQFFPDDAIFALDEVLPACKPEAAAYQKVLDAIGSTAAKCVMFEDSMKNVRATKALGMMTVLIQETMEGGEAGLLGDFGDASDPSVDVVLENIVQMRERLSGLWEGKFPIRQVTK